MDKGLHGTPFCWPYASKGLSSRGLEEKMVWSDYLTSISPCKDGLEHFVYVFQNEHKDVDTVWSGYAIGNSLFGGSLVILEEGEAIKIPMSRIRKPSLSRQSFHQRHLYNDICARNLELSETLPTLLANPPKGATYLVVKVAIRHLRRVSTRHERTYFRQGHANMLVFHLGTRHIFHLEPLDHVKSQDVLLTIERWLGTTILKKLPKDHTWVLASNLDFSRSFRVFPQHTHSTLCRLWSWVMALTLIHNNVKSSASLVSVLQVFSHHSHVILKLIMFFHILTFPPRTCLAACEGRNCLGKERRPLMRANLTLLPLLCPKIPVAHRQTHYLKLLRALEADTPSSSVLRGIVERS